MLEYPSIINSSKAPRANCIAFEKIDGSNIRAKWTKKQGFCLFGSRHELIDQSHKFLGSAVAIFNNNYATALDKYFKKAYPNEREVTVFGEFFGEHSFAGIHEIEEMHDLVIFDVLVGHKNWKFVKPQDFVKIYSGMVRVPKIIYQGNLNQELIDNVRNNKYNLKEGVVCKGTGTNGAFRGGVWMCKIKTLDYLASLKRLHGEDYKKYWE